MQQNMLRIQLVCKGRMLHSNSISSMHRVKFLIFSGKSAVTTIVDIKLWYTV
jgi:hypothetical protein